MHTNLIKHQNALPLGSLETYIHWANRFPMLSEQEEFDLATQCHQDGNIEAARRLILAHLRFVIRIARGYQGYGLAQADLIQEGSIGLMKAVKRFNPTLGVRLASFAVYWIKSEIHEFVLRNWRIVKVATTKAQRKLFFNLRKFYTNACALTPSDVRMIAETLNVSEASVRTMQERLTGRDEPYNHDLEGYDGDISEQPALCLSDNRYAPTQQIEMQERSHQIDFGLKQALGMLDSRSQTIIQERWLNDTKSTLQSLASQLGVSAERVRQIERAAMKKLHQCLKENNTSEAL